jgi:hypothetical protein
MPTLQQILERYRKKFLTYTSWGATEKELSKLIKSKDVEDFITSTYKSIIQGEIERLTDRLKLMEKAEITGLGLPHENSPEIYGNRRVVAYAEGCKNVYKDQINYLQNKLNEIE